MKGSVYLVYMVHVGVNHNLVHEVLSYTCILYDVNLIISFWLKTYVHLPLRASTITIRFTLFLNSLIISVSEYLVEFYKKNSLKKESKTRFCNKLLWTINKSYLKKKTEQNDRFDAIGKLFTTSCETTLIDIYF